MDHAPLLLATVMEIVQDLVVTEDFQVVQFKDVWDMDSVHQLLAIIGINHPEVFVIGITNHPEALAIPGQARHVLVAAPLIFIA
jgi:hypothetical protein